MVRRRGVVRWLDVVLSHNALKPREAKKGAGTMSLPGLGRAQRTPVREAPMNGNLRGAEGDN